MKGGRDITRSEYYYIARLEKVIFVIIYYYKWKNSTGLSRVYIFEGTMKHVNYYETLGISKSAKAEDIRKAYRKLARMYHPDVNKESGAEEKLKQINEANDVLRDPEKRKIYDRYGVEGLQADWSEPSHQRNGRPFHDFSGTGQSHYQQYSSSDSFDEGSGFGDFFEKLFRKKRSNGGSTHHYSGTDRRPKPSPYQATLDLSLEDLFDQSPRQVSFMSQEVDSSGTLRNAEKNLKINIPKGIKDQSVIRLPGVLKNDPMGAADLHVKIALRDHPRFRVEDYDLYTSVVVTPWDAALGGTVSVKTVDGSVSLAIPAGTRNGKKMRLKQKGLPKKSGKAGNLYVTIKIDIPRKLTEEETRLFEELRQKSRFKPGVQQQKAERVS